VAVERYRFIFRFAKIPFSNSEMRGAILRRSTHFIEVDLKFITLEEGFRWGIGFQCPEMSFFPLAGGSEQLNFERVQEGFNLMRDEEYWLAHEYFEKFWKGTERETSLFFHGLVLVCVSMVHYQMGNMENSARLFSRAMKTLSPILSGRLEDYRFGYPLSDEIIGLLEREAFVLLGVQG